VWRRRKAQEPDPSLLEGISRTSLHRVLGLDRDAIRSTLINAARDPFFVSDGKLKFK
jgi:hypothetical protein